MGASSSRYMFMPSWSHTLGSLKAAKAQLQARCSKGCPTVPADLNRMLKAKGPLFSPWNKDTPCPTPGCVGRVWFYTHQGSAGGWPTMMRDGAPHEVERLDAAWRAAQTQKSPASRS